jgi:hypothetical protein
LREAKKAMFYELAKANHPTIEPSAGLNASCKSFFSRTSISAAYGGGPDPEARKDFIEISKKKKKKTFLTHPNQFFFSGIASPFSCNQQLR